MAPIHLPNHYGLLSGNQSFSNFLRPEGKMERVEGIEPS